MIHCFYHSQDLDGHCSGAIVKYRFPEAVMHPINYGDPFPWDEIGQEDVVYMVDFCLQPFTDMERLAEILKRGNLYWFDHHFSAIYIWQSRPYPEPWFQNALRTDMAACEIAWLVLFPDKPVPLAVKLLSLYDSWTYQGHELEDMVLPFQMRMRMEDLDPKDWKLIAGMAWNNLFCSDKLDDLIEEGRLLLHYDEAQKAKYARTYAFETTLHLLSHQVEHPVAYKAIAVNLGHTNSKVFDSVWMKKCPSCCGWGGGEHNLGKVTCNHCEGLGYVEPYDLMITFVRRTDKLWNVSLYSTKDTIDCGAIARSFGGGGHKGAAGFTTKGLPFEY